MASYPNVQFALAKLVPSDANNPSEWKSYIVTAVPTTSTAKDANGNYNIYPGRPGTDNTGTLQAVADQPGSYTYTFWRDVPNIKAQVAAAPEQPVSSNYPSSNKADLGDLTFDTSLPHRLVVQISGAAPGTGTNTLDGKQVTAGVNMANPVNAIYDFKPGAAGAPGTAIPPDQLTREDVNIASCNVCHEKLAFHGGSARVETRYCVACHTEQRAYGQNKVTSTSTSTALAFPTLKETKTVNSTTGITSYTYSPQTAVADGEVSGNFTTMIHKIHQGALAGQGQLQLRQRGVQPEGLLQDRRRTAHVHNLPQQRDRLDRQQPQGKADAGVLWRLPRRHQLGHRRWLDAGRQAERDVPDQRSSRKADTEAALRPTIPSAPCATPRPMSPTTTVWRTSPRTIRVCCLAWPRSGTRSSPRRWTVPATT